MPPLGQDCAQLEEVAGVSEDPLGHDREWEADEGWSFGVMRRLERLVLGWVMAVAAYLLDRRLRRVRREEPTASSDD